MDSVRQKKPSATSKHLSSPMLIAAVWSLDAERLSARRYALTSAPAEIRVLTETVILQQGSINRHCRTPWLGEELSLFLLQMDQWTAEAGRSLRDQL